MFKTKSSQFIINPPKIICIGDLNTKLYQVLNKSPISHINTIVPDKFFIFFVIQFSFIWGNSIKVSQETLKVPIISKNFKLFKPTDIDAIIIITIKININL